MTEQEKRAEQKKWAAKLVQGVLRTIRNAKKDERSSGDYWNGDTWGSISGIRDAEEWVEGRAVEYVMRRAMPRPKGLARKAAKR